MGRIRRSYKLLDQRSFSDSRVQNTSNIFNVAVSGVVSSEKKDYHLQNGHYVLRFSLAVKDHYSQIFESSKDKVTSIMWINCEVWDDKAKLISTHVTKGNRINLLGTLIENKWVDKVDGTERKQFLVRVNNIVSDEKLKAITDAFEMSDSS